MTGKIRMKNYPEHFTPYGYKSSHISPTLRIHNATGSDLYHNWPSMGACFSSCSAAEMRGMSGDYLTTRARREEFVWQIYMDYHNRKCIYFLPTSAQMKPLKDKKSSVLHMLFELGAVEVYNAPNNQPGHHHTNLMHLCVLNCGTDDFRERCARYLGVVEAYDFYGYRKVIHIPRFVIEKCGFKEIEDVNKYYNPKVTVFTKEGLPEVVSRARVYKRDPDGKFAKVAV
jgi:hypothetical protein